MTWRFSDFGKPESFTKYLRQTLVSHEIFASTDKILIPGGVLSTRL